MTRVLLVPAAGRGARLGSPLPKLMTPVAGRAMIDHILDRYRAVVSGTVVVIHPADRLMVDAHLRANVSVQFAEQAEPTGMLDAILVASDAVLRSRPDRIWVTWCDQVLISPGTVAALSELDASSADQDVIMPIVRQALPYIHFDRDRDGRLTAVRQRREGDVMPETGTSDAGLFSLSRKAFDHWMREYAAQVQVGGGTGERNFLPFLPWLAQRADIMTFEIDVAEAAGVNTPEDLAAAERRLGSMVAETS